MRRWLLCCVLFALACERPTGLAVTVKGLRRAPTAEALIVTCRRGAEAPVQAEFPLQGLTLEDEDTVRLGLELPPGVRGPVTVTVQAVPRAEEAFVQARGTASDELRERRLDLTVPLERQQLCSQSGWCWEVPSPGARLLRALWGSSRQDLWAAGQFGTLLHYDGRYWSVEPLPAEAGEADLYALWGTGWDDVWAVGGLPVYQDWRPPLWGVVLHYDGVRWRVVQRGEQWEHVTGVHGYRRGEAWIAGTLRDPRGLSPIDGFTARCTPEGCDGEERLGASLDHPPKEYGVLYGVWASGEGRPLWAVGSWRDAPAEIDNGVILRRRPGERWQVVQTLDKRRFTRIWGYTDPVKGTEDLWAGVTGEPDPLSNGNSSSFFLQRGGDDTQWDLHGAGEPFPLQDDGLLRWGLKAGGVTSLLPGAQAPWRDEGAAVPGDFAMSPPLDATRASPLRLYRSAVHALWAVGKEEVWAAGANGLLRHYVDRSWEGPGSLPIGALPVFHGLWAADGQTAYAVGERGVIQRYDGATWVAEESPTDRRLLGVWGLPSGDVFAVGLDGLILRRQGGSLPSGGGGRWVREASPVPTDLFALWGSGPGDLWAVGAGGVILNWRDGAWSVVRQGTATLLGVWGAGPSERWAVGCEGYGTEAAQQVVLRRVGDSWQPVPSPVAMAVPGQSCLERVWFESADDVYVSGTFGQYRFDGKAQRWSKLMQSLSGSCMGRGSGDLLCGTTFGRILRGDGIAPWVYSAFGAENASAPNEVRKIFTVGDDVWSYGAGIVHCKGRTCDAPRR